MATEAEIRAILESVGVDPDATATALDFAKESIDPDAAPPPAEPVDYRSADHATWSAEAAKYGIRPRSSR